MIITLIKKDWSSKSHSMLTPEAKYTAIRTPLQRDGWWVICFVCLFGFLTSSSTTRLYRGRAQGQSVWQFYVLPHTRESWETMTSASAGRVGVSRERAATAGTSSPGVARSTDWATASHDGSFALYLTLSTFFHAHSPCLLVLFLQPPLLF